VFDNKDLHPKKTTSSRKRKGPGPLSQNETEDEDEFIKIGVFDNNEHDQAFFLEKEKLSNKKKPCNRYRKGTKPLSPDEIVGEEHKRNAKRCREYRCKKKSAAVKEMTKLQDLVAKNDKLKLQEQGVKDKIKRLKCIYIKLIDEGKIKSS